MTLTQLEYILAVYKEKHFGRAAKSCFVTQPTLSMQIQKLEDELGVILFDRSKTPIQQTSEGQLIIEQAQRIIHEQKKLFSIVEESKAELTGEFTLAVIPTLSPFILPLFIQNFVEKYPKVKIQIVENKTEDIIELLKRDEVDAALLATPLHTNLVEKILYYEPFYLFTSPNSPLAKKKIIKEEDLDLKDLWLLDKGNCFRDQVLNICTKHNQQDTKSPIKFESGNFETLKNMVLQGHGYTILPHMAVGQLSTPHKKFVRGFKNPIPTREIALVHTHDSLKGRIIEALEEEILSVVPDSIRDLKPKNMQVLEIKAGY